MTSGVYKHMEHILAVPASLFEGRENGFCDYELKLEDIFIGQRKGLENNSAFRQIIPISIFVNQGKVWAYRRTPKSGEVKLQGKQTVCVGGHWDVSDLVIHQEGEMAGMIDLEASLKNTFMRELTEEINITAPFGAEEGDNEIKITQLSRVIAADDVPVDTFHVAIVYMHELQPGWEVHAAEDNLEGLGFFTPEEVLGFDNLETWGRLACEILISQRNAAQE
jgi:predicted NUDIX family phosphoesterase